MGTSNQILIGSDTIKRNTSLHKNYSPDKTVDITDSWKTKSLVPGSKKDTHERIFVPASNVNRVKEDGCMNKIKIERSSKLVEEDTKGRKFNIINGVPKKDSDWMRGYGN